ncbi:MAG: hypothetical protein WDO16_07445 [Bacteroidota bacterium]
MKKLISLLLLSRHFTDHLFAQDVYPSNWWDRYEEYKPPADDPS